MGRIIVWGAAGEAEWTGALNGVCIDGLGLDRVYSSPV